MSQQQVVRYPPSVSCGAGSLLSLHNHLLLTFAIQLQATPWLTLLQSQVYSKIIDEVCDASQIDFEEGGVDSETLKLLKQVSNLDFVLSSHENEIARNPRCFGRSLNAFKILPFHRHRRQILSANIFYLQSESSVTLWWGWKWPRF